MTTFNDVMDDNDREIKELREIGCLRLMDIVSELRQSRQALDKIKDIVQESMKFVPVEDEIMNVIKEINP